jgi:hypothetical protein
VKYLVVGNLSTNYFRKVKTHSMSKRNSFYIVIILLALVSCKKSSGETNPILEKYFEENILTRNFVVSHAKDGTADLTSIYSGYTFVLLKTDLYHGPMTAAKDGVIYNGSWSSNNDYSKLIITLPETPPEFAFLSRSWRFTSKNLPTLKLAPWGSNEPVELHMLRK